MLQRNPQLQLVVVMLVSHQHLLKSLATLYGSTSQFFFNVSWVHDSAASQQESEPLQKPHPLPC